MSVTVFIKNSCQTVGEGPHWEESTQTLSYVDIYCGDVHKYNTLTKEDTKVNIGDTVGYVVPRKSGGYVVGLGLTFSHLDWENNHVSTIVGGIDAGKNNRFNDGKCDPAGRLWAGTMSEQEKPGMSHPYDAALYLLDKDKHLTSHVQQVSISNGLAWSADNTTMYWIDSTPRQVYAFDFDIGTGEISNKKVVADWSALDEPGCPDGMCVDEEGKLWIACFNGSKVVRLDPQTGTILQQVKFPAARITSCCFGGPNYDELFVTSSRYLVPHDEIAKYPLAGSVFRVTGLGVKGMPPMLYEG